MACWTIPIINLYTLYPQLLIKAIRIHHQASVAASASWPVVALPSAASPAGFLLKPLKSWHHLSIVQNPLSSSLCTGWFIGIPLLDYYNAPKNGLVQSPYYTCLSTNKTEHRMEDVAQPVARKLAVQLSHTLCRSPLSIKGGEKGGSSWGISRGFDGILNMIQHQPQVVESEFTLPLLGYHPLEQLGSITA